jgi:glycosyltransferase 2 family protein
VKWFVLAGQVTVTILVLFIIIRKIDFHAIRSVLQQAIGPGFLLLIFLFLATKVLFASQIKLELIGHGIKIGLARLVKVYLIVSFYALAVPGDIAAGGIAWLKLGKEANAWAESGITLIYLRLLNMLLLFIIGTIGILCDPFFFSTRFRPVFIVAIIMFILLLVPFFSPKFSWPLEKCLNGITVLMPERIRRLPIWNKCLTIIREFPLHSRKRLLGNVVLSLLIHGSNIVMLYTSCKVLSINLPLTVMVWLCPVLTIIALFPFAFGGLGVREGLFLLILSPYPVSNAQKVAFSLLIYIIAFVTGGLSGAFLELRDTLFSRKKTT